MMGASWSGHVVVTGNGVEQRELDQIEPFQHPRPYLFTAARFTPKKGLDILIRATKQPIDEGFEIDLILAGDGPLDRTLRNLVEQLGLEDRVRFWGVATRREIAMLLRGCELFVLPSLWEAFGIAILEAMVCARAVVASRCGGIPEIVRANETGLLVPPGDVSALSQAIAGLLRDTDRREMFGRRGRDVALAEYSWSAVTDRYLQAYTTALGG
jgi:glycosyltransferase involved in cell wall biosynthesis